MESPKQNLLSSIQRVVVISFIALGLLSVTVDAALQWRDFRIEG